MEQKKGGIMSKPVKSIDDARKSLISAMSGSYDEGGIVKTIPRRNDDVPNFLKDKNYIISTSVQESTHVAILEGMACGLKPIIHNWPGSETIYPEKYLFNSVDDFVKSVMGEYKTKEYRDFIETKHSQVGMLKKIEKLINEEVCIET